MKPGSRIPKLADRFPIAAIQDDAPIVLRRATKGASIVFRLASPAKDVLGMAKTILDAAAAAAPSALIGVSISWRHGSSESVLSIGVSVKAAQKRTGIIERSLFPFVEKREFVAALTSNVASLTEIGDVAATILRKRKIKAELVSGSPKKHTKAFLSVHQIPPAEKETAEENVFNFLLNTPFSSGRDFIVLHGETFGCFAAPSKDLSWIDEEAVVNEAEEISGASVWSAERASNGSIKTLRLFFPRLETKAWGALDAVLKVDQALVSASGVRWRSLDTMILDAFLETLPGVMPFWTDGALAGFIAGGSQTKTSNFLGERLASKSVVSEVNHGDR